MANASSKRIATANARALKNLHLGLLIANVLPFLIRVILRKPIIPSWGPLTLYILTTAVSLVLAAHLTNVGKGRRDAQGNVKAGEDLSGSGITEFCWDVIYMTWLCANGSALISNKIWYLYLAIPGYGAYKLFNIARPLLSMALPGIFGPSAPPNSNSNAGAAPAANGDPELSRKQQKLKARMDKGDKRIQQVSQRR